VSADYELVLFGAMGSIALLMFLGGLATPSVREQIDAKPGLSAGYVALVVVGSVALPLALGVVGEFPSDGIRAMGFDLVLVAFGLVGVALSAGNAARWLRFRVVGDTPTGDVTEGPVALTGTVEHDDPPQSPFFGSAAVAWMWTVAAKNRHGTTYEGRRAWEDARTGQDGVPFRVDDGTGPVRVEPTGAQFDLAGETVEERDPGDWPGRAAEVADLDVGGERFRFRESTVAPGDTVTVLGVASGSPPTVADATDEPFVVSDGPREWTLRRYALRALGFGAGGALAVWFGFRWLLGAFGVAIPV
jgi:hypothetical protein